MPRVHCRFYAELNDFLPPSRRQVTFAHEVKGRAAVKDVIESLGVPHTEVDLILVNGESVDFGYLVQEGDRIAVYPVFESIDITPILRVRPRPLREPRFVVDGHLGRLAAYLRMLGFDTLYRNDYTDAELAKLSAEEGRILLTRDRGLLKRSQVTHGYCLRHITPREQAVEVLRRFDLRGAVRPFRRCLRCNGLLREVAREDVWDLLPLHVRAEHEEFRRCTRCGQVYWKGSHYRRMCRLVQELLGQAGEVPDAGSPAG